MKVYLILAGLAALGRTVLFLSALLNTIVAVVLFLAGRHFLSGEDWRWLFIAFVTCPWLEERLYKAAIEAEEESNENT